MKKSLFLFLMPLLMMSSCLMMDWSPIDLWIEVQNEEGQDLLNPENDLSWLEGTTITFRGKTTTLTLDDGPQATYLPPTFHGFRLQKMEGRYLLEYGELDGSEEFDNEEFTLTWPDGTVDRITYKRRVSAIAINAYERWHLNGEKCNNPVIIVK